MDGTGDRGTLPGDWGKSLAALLLLVGALLGPPAGATGIRPGQDDRLEDLGDYSPPWFAELLDVQLDGDLVYEFGVGGLAIFSVANPDLPVELGRYEPPGHPFVRYYRGAALNGLACGGGREDRLTFIDVTVPGSPQALKVFGQRGHSYEGVALVPGYAYACRHSAGFEVIDTTNPALPVSAAEITSLVNAWDVALSGNTAYVADGTGGLAVIDITDPTAPVHLTSRPVSGAAVDVAVSGTILVVCAGSAGIDVFEITNPASPVWRSNYNTSGLAMTAAIAGNLVYVADWDDVEIIDLSNPSLPQFVGGEDTPVRAMGLDARADLVVVADWSRLRTYRPGPSTRGDLQVSVRGIDLGFVPVGATVDTTFVLSNTGNATLAVSRVRVFNPDFEVLTPGPFEIPVGGSTEVTIRFVHQMPGFASTFLRIDAEDSDEAVVTFPLSADDDPVLLDVGNLAPDWTHADMGGVVHNLANYRGRIVVMSFFANW